MTLVRFASASLVLAMVAGASSLAYAQGGTPSSSANAQNVDSACTQEAATANCGNEKVGTGLMNCLHKYKKANPSFKISEQCHAAMKKDRMGK